MHLLHLLNIKNYKYNKTVINGFASYQPKKKLLDDDIKWTRFIMNHYKFKFSVVQNFTPSLAIEITENSSNSAKNFRL